MSSGMFRHVFGDVSPCLRGVVRDFSRDCSAFICRGKHTEGKEQIASVPSHMVQLKNTQNTLISYFSVPKKVCTDRENFLSPSDIFFYPSPSSKPSSSVLSLHAPLKDLLPSLYRRQTVTLTARNVRNTSNIMV
jgi:hypothetical protein